MTWKRALLIYPYSPDKKSEMLYGGLDHQPDRTGGCGVETEAAVDEAMLLDMRLENSPWRTSSASSGPTSSASR